MSLTFVEKVGPRRYRFRCDCGGEAFRQRRAADRGNCINCRRNRPRDMHRYEVGTVHGRWTIVARDRGGVRVRCACGEIRSMQTSNLASGASTSCGCYKREVAGSQVRRHGLSGSGEYRSWAGMIVRCTDPDSAAWEHYGARGIRVHAAWVGRGGFERFVAHVGPRPSPQHSIDRIDNDGNYEPGNVRWATAKEQARNTRRNVWIELNGERLCASDIASRAGVSRQAIEQRIASGWTAEELLRPNTGRRGWRHGYRCSNCGKNGHNRATCVAAAPPTGAAA